MNKQKPAEPDGAQAYDAASIKVLGDLEAVQEAGDVHRIDGCNGATPPCMGGGG